MAGPGVPIEGAAIRDDLRAKRVDVQVADEFEEGHLLLHHDGLVPILEEMPAARMPPVEGPRIPSQEGAHTTGQRPHPGADQQIGMIREERPGADGEDPGGLCEGSPAREEVGPIPVIPEDHGPLDPPHHHLVGVPVEDSGRRAEGIETRLTWHDTAKGTTRRRRMQGPVLLIPVFLRPDLKP